MVKVTHTTPAPTHTTNAYTYLQLRSHLGAHIPDLHKEAGVQPCQEAVLACDARVAQHLHVAARSETRSEESATGLGTGQQGVACTYQRLQRRQDAHALVVAHVTGKQPAQARHLGGAGSQQHGPERTGLRGLVQQRRAAARHGLT